MYHRFLILILLVFFCIIAITAQAQEPPIRNRNTGIPSRTSGTITESRVKPPPDRTIEQKKLPSSTDSDSDTKGKKDQDQTEKEKVEQLDSYAFDKDVVKNRIFSWQVNRYLNTPILCKIDTMISDRRNDLIYRRDVGATYLGVSGSAAITFNYFQQRSHDFMYALAPFNDYFVTPDNLQFYNTRTPFTRFTYSGNPFSSQQFEELNLETLHTQNITPEWNTGLLYRHIGGNGLLPNEATDVRTFTLFTSYSGKRYFAQAGYIYNGTNNKQNGGVTNDFNILDTTFDVRTVPVHLNNAKETINTNTFFLVHTYGIPLKFLYKREVADSLDTGEGSTVYFGNSVELTNTKRIYKDNINTNDSIGRAFYNNRFYINPTTSNDSIHTTLFDARVFMTLQPFASDYIISKVTGGIGYRHLSNYGFEQDYYIRPVQDNKQNNLYLYGNAQGNFRQFFSWSAFARYYITGHNQHDLFFSADAALSLFPMKQGLHLWGRLTMDHRTTDYFLQNYYGNHLKWKNIFDKTIETKIEAGLRIPDWDINASIGSSLLKSPVFFDTTAMPRQSNEIVSILSIFLEKNFKLWLIHFDNRALIQFSSAQDIVPLPALALNSALYIELEAVKNVLTAQIGGDLYYHTLYYAYGYNPAAGAFHTQRTRETGNCPYIDIFLNVKWKRATFFVKYINATEGWPNSDYFSALHYIKPQTVLKFGISWPFYL